MGAEIAKVKAEATYQLDACGVARRTANSSPVRNQANGEDGRRKKKSRILVEGRNRWPYCARGTHNLQKSSAELESPTSDNTVLIKNPDWREAEELGPRPTETRPQALPSRLLLLPCIGGGVTGQPSSCRRSGIAPDADRERLLEIGKSYNTFSQTPPTCTLDRSVSPVAPPHRDHLRRCPLTTRHEPRTPHQAFLVSRFSSRDTQSVPDRQGSALPRAWRASRTSCSL